MLRHYNVHKTYCSISSPKHGHIGKKKIFLFYWNMIRYIIYYTGRRKGLIFQKSCFSRLLRQDMLISPIRWFELYISRWVNSFSSLVKNIGNFLFVKVSPCFKLIYDYYHFLNADKPLIWSWEKSSDIILKQAAIGIEHVLNTPFLLIV